MESEELPSEFDAIVLGTGLTESIVAAALSRIGKKVLHLDRNQYYGSHWATFSFEEFMQWIQDNLEIADDDDLPIVHLDGVDIIPIPQQDLNISNIIVKSYIRNEPKPVPEDSTLNEQTIGENNDSNEDNSEIIFEEKVDLKDAVNAAGVYETPIDEIEDATLQNSSLSSHTTEKLEGNLSDNAYEEGKQNDDTAASEGALAEKRNNENEACERTATAVSDDNVVGFVVRDTIADGNLASDAVLQDVDAIESEAAGAALSAANASQGSATGNIDNAPSNSVQFAQASPATSRILAQSRIASHAADDISLADFICLARKFNLDIAPKLLFARGQLIELLINANITHYSEFRTAERILTLKEREIVQVPCSRADVFSSDAVSVMEKRVLMKFLSFCVTYDEHPQEYEEFSEKPFVEFLIHKRLSKNLQHYVVHAIAMVNEYVNTLTGLRESQKFLRSLGRYSNSPFVWTLYGMSELPQAFCRMSAVFGGTYCLRHSAKTIKIDKGENILIGITCTENQDIATKHLIMNRSYLPKKLSTQKTNSISRGVLITNKSIKQSEEEHVTLLTIPPGDGLKVSVRVIEIGPSSMACPMGLYVVQLTSTGVESAEQDLKPAVNFLFETEDIEGSSKPRLLWCTFFNHVGRDDSDNYDLPSNAFVTNLPGETLGFEDAVNEAKTIFDKICPDSEFLPAVPNPEDIIWDDASRQLKPAGGFLQMEEEDGAAQGQLDVAEPHNEIVVRQEAAAQIQENDYVHDEENAAEKGNGNGAVQEVENAAKHSQEDTASSDDTSGSQ